MSKGPFDFEYPNDLYLSRPRDLNDGCGKRPELYLKKDHHGIPQGLATRPKLISFARLMQKLEEGSCHILRVETNTIVFEAEAINDGLAPCNEAMGGQHQVLFRVNFTAAVADNVRDAFAAHAPEMLERSDYLPDGNHTAAAAAIKQRLEGEGLFNRHFIMQAQVLKDAVVEKEWYDVQVLAHALTGQPVCSDVDDFARSRNTAWPHANEPVEIMSAEDGKAIDMAISYIRDFLYEVLNEASAYDGEPENMRQLRIQIVQAMLAEIEVPQAADDILNFKAAHLYRQFAQGMPAGKGSALHIVYAEIKHFITRELVKYELAGKPGLLTAIGDDAFGIATALTRHQTDSDFDPAAGCTKVKFEAPENVSVIAPTKDAPGVIGDKRLRDLIELPHDAKEALFHSCVCYLRGIDKEHAVLVHTYARRSSMLATVHQLTAASGRYTEGVAPPTMLEPGSPLPLSGGRSPRDRSGSRVARRWARRRASSVSPRYAQSGSPDAAPSSPSQLSAPGSGKRSSGGVYEDLVLYVEAAAIFERDSVVVRPQPHSAPLPGAIRDDERQATLHSLAVFSPVVPWEDGDAVSLAGSDKNGDAAEIPKVGVDVAL